MYYALGTLSTLSNLIFCELVMPVLQMKRPTEESVLYNITGIVLVTWTHTWQVPNLELFSQSHPTSSFFKAILYD